MTSIAERNRTRLVNIYLATLVHKTGAMVVPVKLPDGKMTAIELDSEIVSKALIKFFETAVRKVISGDAADREIAETYGECVKLKSGKLSDIVVGFMSALLTNLIEQAFGQRGAE